MSELQGYFRQHFTAEDAAKLTAARRQLEAAAAVLGDVGDHQHHHGTEERAPLGAALGALQVRIGDLGCRLEALLDTEVTQ